MRESDLQTRVKRELQGRGWDVRNLHGNKFQPGLPDLLVKPPGRPAFFVELKLPGGRLTRAQRRVFPELAVAGWNIWVVIGDLGVLTDPPNWREWWTPIKVPGVDKIRKALKKYG